MAAAAHDMKNSVCVIAAYLEEALAQLSQQPGSPAAHTTAQALYETQRVNGNLVQLLAVYKLQAGMYPFEPVPVTLAEFAAEAVARVAPLAGIKGLALRTELPADAAEWYFDRDLVASVVVQSLFNAVRYARSAVLLQLRCTADGLEIEVADDGAGFPAFLLEQGFAPRQAIDTRSGSTGLGLYFSRLVAQLHRHGSRTGSTRLDNGGVLAGGRFIIALP